MELVCAVKKAPGKLILHYESIKWVAASGAPTLEMQLSNVQGMQATPPTASKLRIKLSKKDGDPLMLEFGTAADLERARSELQSAIKQSRAANGGDEAATNTPSTSTASKSAPDTPDTLNKPTVGAQTATKKKKISLDPAKLLLNLDLQRVVLKQDPELMQKFEQVVITSGAITNEQFWSPRVHLLVAAAQQQAQSRGSYNVLSTIKPTTTGDNRVNINLTREKIADLFDQYPLVRKAYNELVPKLNEGSFWQRFFMSRLFMVLKGEKVAHNHSTDALLDPYINTLHELQEKQRLKRIAEDEDRPAPLFINIETNSLNNPETYGNNITTTAGGGTRSLIRSMNGLSQRLLRGKKRGRETETEENMQEDIVLHDLAPEPPKDPDVGLQLDLHPDNDAAMEVDSNEMKRFNYSLLSNIPSHIALEDTVENSDSWREGQQKIDSLTPHDHLTHVKDDIALDKDLLLLHATSLEFLKQFWFAVHNKPIEEVRAMRVYLENSLTRIKAVNGLPALQSVVDSLNSALKLHV